MRDLILVLDLCQNKLLALIPTPDRVWELGLKTFLTNALLIGLGLVKQLKKCKRLEEVVTQMLGLGFG